MLVRLGRLGGEPTCAIRRATFGGAIRTIVVGVQVVAKVAATAGRACKPASPTKPSAEASASTKPATKASSKSAPATEATAKPTTSGEAASEATAEAAAEGPIGESVFADLKHIAEPVKAVEHFCNGQLGIKGKDETYRWRHGPLLAS